MELWEEFLSTGREPAFWTTRVETSFERTELDGETSFQFELQRLEAGLGANDVFELFVEEGALPVRVLQDPASQRVQLEGIGSVARFVNSVVDGLGEVPRRVEWTETVRVADGTVLEGFEPVERSVTIRPLEGTPLEVTFEPQ